MGVLCWVGVCGARLQKFPAQTTPRFDQLPPDTAACRCGASLLPRATQKGVALAEFEARDQSLVTPSALTFAFPACAASGAEMAKSRTQTRAAADLLSAIRHG